MRIGDLRHRIKLQSPSRTADGRGGFVTEWLDEAEVWAGVWPVSATERMAAGQQAMTATHRVRIRYRSIAPGWRVAFGTRYFTITGIVNKNEQNREIDLICQEAIS